MGTSVMHRVANRLPAGILRGVGRWQLDHPLFARVTRPLANSLRKGDVTISHGLGAGLKINAAGANPGYAMGVTEPDVQDALDRQLHPGATFYDIGASVGFFTIIAASIVGEGGRVLAFEPRPEAAARLRHNLALNHFSNVDVRECAVTDMAGRGELEVGEELVWAALRQRGPDHVTPGADAVEVETTTIDDVVRQAGEPPGLVKLDIEGGELPAIKGMTETIRRHQPPIICECHGTFRDVESLLRSFGYVVSLLERSRRSETDDWIVHVLAVADSQPAR
jgi:FkbM family methyltransferase